MGAIKAEQKIVLVGAGFAALGLLYLVKKKGAAKGLGEGIGNAAVALADGAVTGVVDSLGQIVGLPTSKETITDANECKLYLDANGYWAASAKCSGQAFIAAQNMPAKVVDSVSQVVGLPTTSETITDAQECKIYLDANGYWAASAKCSAGAFLSAITM